MRFPTIILVFPLVGVPSLAPAAAIGMSLFTEFFGVSSGVALARELARAFQVTQVSGEERHRRRLKNVEALEARYPDGATRVEREGRTHERTA